MSDCLVEEESSLLCALCSRTEASHAQGGTQNSTLSSHGTKGYCLSPTLGKVRPISSPGTKLQAMRAPSLPLDAFSCQRPQIRLDKGHDLCFHFSCVPVDSSLTLRFSATHPSQLKGSNHSRWWPFRSVFVPSEVDLKVVKIPLVVRHLSPHEGAEFFCCLSNKKKKKRRERGRERVMFSFSYPASETPSLFSGVSRSFVSGSSGSLWRCTGYPLDTRLHRGSALWGLCSSITFPHAWMRKLTGTHPPPFSPLQPVPSLHLLLWCTDLSRPWRVWCKHSV